MIVEQIPAAPDVVDPLHLMPYLAMAPAEVRRAAVARLRREGYETILTKARRCLLKRRENPMEHQEVRLEDNLQNNLESVRNHMLGENFQRFSEYTSPEWAAKFRDCWCTGTIRSRIGPIKKLARSLRRDRNVILNRFRAWGTISSGVVE